MHPIEVAPARAAGLMTCLLLLASTLSAQDDPPRDFDNYPPAVAAHLTRIYADGQQAYSYRDDFPGGFDRWSKDARAELSRLLGLPKIARQNEGHRPEVKLGEVEDCGEFTRRRATIETEPNVVIPFWLLVPKGDGPFPVGIFPHGHDSSGHDTTAGVYHDEAHRRRALEEDRDVAVQAAKRGMLAIAPATRGIAVDGVPDLKDRHGGRYCRSHVVHCLLAGRTAIGERVWDMQRLLDWALARDDVDKSRVLMMGNSGGGMVTLYAAACEPRITVAVPSCSFSTVTSPTGYVYHCDCNLVPGILAWGDLYDVAGLAAPRHLLAVNGRHDGLHSPEDIERSARRAKAIFAAAGCPERFEHRWGEQGHRFYADLMWPFVQQALEKRQ
ncbi:MAG: acetylxylan esterase [Pirellulaceae bacterium]